jgi:hypothetical protein
MERQEVEQLLDILAEHWDEGWTYHSENDIHIFLHNAKFKKPPHMRIRRDNGIIECLNGITFRYGPDNVIGWRMPCQDFIDLVTKRKAV